MISIRKRGVGDEHGASVVVKRNAVNARMQFRLVRIVVLVSLCGCGIDRNASRPSVMTVIQQQIADGVSADELTEFMLSEGFTCEHVRQGNFVAQEPGGSTTEVELEGIDFIECHRFDEGGVTNGFVSHAWSIALILGDEGRVVDVAQHQVLYGP